MIAKHIRYGIIAIGAFAAPLAAHAQIDGDIDDATISRAIQRELWDARAVDANAIDVNVADGIVILGGTVDDIIAEERAIRIAKMTRGVTSVVDELEVGVSGRTDSEIQERIDDALVMDPATDSWEVMASVENGIVTLTGTVQSSAERTLAGRVARSVLGVRGIDNRIEITYAEERADPAIQADIEQLLSWDVRLDDTYIETRVDSGQVTLTGSVGSVFERDLARSLAWVTGVEGVDTAGLDVRWWREDELQRRSAWVDAEDEQISAAVRRAMLYDPRVESFEIEVSASDGTVTLEGTVDNLKARRAAAQAARHTIGVWRVENYVKVRPVAVLSDAQIAVDIQEALARDAIVSASQISVSVDDGLAQLFGRVNSEFERRHAEDIAARVNGVTSVDNQLDTFYWSPRTSYRYDDWDPMLYDYEYGYRSVREKSDDEIQSDIETEIFWSPYVDADQVEVSVQDGIATLMGTVEDQYERRMAAENALEGGAYRVINELGIGMTD